MTQPTSYVCNCLPNECHAAPGWTCRKKALTSKNRTRRFVVGLNGASFMGMFQVGNPNGWGGVHAEYVLASDHDAEIERLREENRALRNLANNLRPGPISQALQESPDYSGQTIKRLRAALNEVSKTLAYQGFGRTHWNGCERSHWTCRLGKIVEDALSGDSQPCTCRKLPEPPSDDCPIVEAFARSPRRVTDETKSNEDSFGHL